MRSRQAVIAAAVLGLAAYIWVYATGLADPVIRSDGFSYYVYVPSWFLYQDTSLSAVARDCCGGSYSEVSGIVRWPATRRWVNVHPIGVALMQAPAFPLAHALTKWTNLTPDGFSLYYQHAAGLTGLAWIIAGLALVRRLLLHYFTDAVVAVTVLVLFAGTNLLHHGTFDASYSHAYSFFLVAALLVLSRRWFESPALQTSVLIGVTAGLIVLVRHTNALMLNVFWLYGLAAFGPREFLQRMRAGIGGLAVITAVGAALLVPQLALYYRATGSLLVSPYALVGQGFNWTSPRLFDVLFGVTKGLFFWTPLLLLAVAGFVRLLRTGSAARAFVLPAVVVLSLQAYLVASWWDWQLGGSYGSRGFVDTLALFSIGLAAFVDWTWRSFRVRTAALAVIAALCALSLFQMLQSWYRIIPFNDTTWPLYREIFLRWR